MCPQGPKRPGLAWPPGLQRQAQAQEVGVELAGHGGGDRECWELRPAVAIAITIGKRNRPVCLLKGGRGWLGKHVRPAGPEPGLLPSSEA